jgi:hypothetical protein
MLALRPERSSYVFFLFSRLNFIRSQKVCEIDTLALKDFEFLAVFSSVNFQSESQNTISKEACVIVTVEAYFALEEWIFSFRVLKFNLIDEFIWIDVELVAFKYGPFLFVFHFKSENFGLKILLIIKDNLRVKKLVDLRSCFLIVRYLRRNQT